MTSSTGSLRRTTTSGVTQNYQYVYDRWGNRPQQNALNGGLSPQFSFNTTTNQINSGGYAYDAAGNMTSDSFHNYTYDGEGEITQVDGGSTATYAYDALYHRVSFVVSGVTTDFVFNPAGQRTSTEDVTHGWEIEGQTYWGASPVVFAEASAAHFQHQDWLETERMRTTYNGGVEGTFGSLPFGDGFSTLSGNDNDPYHFAGLDHDYGSNTEHAQFRQYSSTQGRWLRPDPYSGSYDFSNPQSFNRYVYALNKPLTYTDPSGLDAISCFNYGVGCDDMGGGGGDVGSGGDGVGGNDPCQGNYNNCVSVNGGDPNSCDMSDPLCQWTSGLGPGVSVGGGTAPNTGTIRPMSRLDCASYRADKELSIASMTSGSSPDNPVVQAFLGNSFSGVVNLVTSNENPLKNLLTGGWNPGIPGVPSPEIGGYALDGGLTGVATKAVLGGATDLFALPKLAYDAATFLGAAAFLCR